MIKCYSYLKERKIKKIFKKLATEKKYFLKEYQIQISRSP